MSKRIGRPPKLFLFRGQRMTVKQVQAITGLSDSGVRSRISGDTVLEGEDLKDRHQEPKKHEVIIFYRGQAKNVATWAREIGISVSTLHCRLAWGWTIEQALTVQPVSTKQRAFNHRIVTRIVSTYRGSSQTLSTPHKDRRGRHLPERADFKTPIETKFHGGKA
jgi:hypothetical protein